MKITIGQYKYKSAFIPEEWILISALLSPIPVGLDDGVTFVHIVSKSNVISTLEDKGICSCGFIDHLDEIMDRLGYSAYTCGLNGMETYALRNDDTGCDYLSALANGEVKSIGIFSDKRYRAYLISEKYMDEYRAFLGIKEKSVDG